MSRHPAGSNNKNYEYPCADWSKNRDHKADNNVQAYCTVFIQYLVYVQYNCSTGMKAKKNKKMLGGLCDDAMSTVLLFIGRDSGAWAPLRIVARSTRAQLRGDDLARSLCIQVHVDSRSRGRS